MTDSETIGYDVTDGVATITLSRPLQRNTVTYAMLDELLDAFDRVDRPDVRGSYLVRIHGTGCRP